MRALGVLAALLLSTPVITGAAYNGSVEERLSLALSFQYSDSLVLWQGFQILEVDSSAGTNPDIIDPYGTLQGRILFGARNTRFATYFGVFQNDRIVWLSPSLGPEFTYGEVTSTRDLDRDQSLDLLVALYHGPNLLLVDLWAFAWDGSDGTVLNQLDDFGQSTVRSETGGFLPPLDIDADGFYELIGSEISDDGEGGEERRKIVYGFENGMLMPSNSRAQLASSKYTLANRFLCFLDAVVSPATRNHLSFEYTLGNSESSGQSINFLYIASSGDSVNGLPPSGWRSFRVPELSLVGFSGMSNSDEILAGQLKSGIRIMSSRSPVGIVQFYAQSSFRPLQVDPTNVLLNYQENIVQNSQTGFTVAPAAASWLAQAPAAIDSLAECLTRAFTYGWIHSRSALEEYLSLLHTSRVSVDSGNSVGAITSWQLILQAVQRDSGSVLTSEAYALLRYNVEYLLERLQSGEAPHLASLSPALTLARSGEFTMTITGNGFVPESRVLWNGSERTTSFASPSELQAVVRDADIFFRTTATVTVRNPGGQLSDTLTFSAVNTLPAPVRPVLECVKLNPGGTYTAWFGYKNENPVPVYIPAGAKNKFSPPPQDREQTTVFLPGRMVRVFSVDFPGNNLVWTLNGRTSTASRKSARCP